MKSYLVVKPYVLTYVHVLLCALYFEVVFFQEVSMTNACVCVCVVLDLRLEKISQF